MYFPKYFLNVRQLKITGLKILSCGCFRTVFVLINHLKFNYEVIYCLTYTTCLIINTVQTVLDYMYLFHKTLISFVLLLLTRTQPHSVPTTLPHLPIMFLLPQLLYI